MHLQNDIASLRPKKMPGTRSSTIDAQFDIKIVVFPK